MARYADKQKMKNLNEKGKCLSPLARYLISEGYSYDEAEEGLEPLISWWEESISYIEQSKSTDIGASEEYDHDLWPRTELFKAMQHASEDEVNQFRERITILDQKFKNATVQTNYPINHVENPDAGLHWWLFRWLKN